MAQEAYDVINQFVQGVKMQLGSHIQNIILYGSYARGGEKEILILIFYCWLI